MDFMIAPASADDAEIVAELTQELLEEIMVATGSGQFSVDRAALATLGRDFLVCGLYTVYLAHQGGQAAGFIALSETRALYAGGSFGIITELYVRPALRSSGLGARLLAAAREHGKVRGWTRLEVTTPPLPEFDRTLHFYETSGFGITGGRKLKTTLG